MISSYVILLYLAIFANRNSQTLKNFRQILNLISGKNRESISLSKITSIQE